MKILAGVLLSLLTVSAAQEPGVPLALTPFTGSTGGSATELVRKELTVEGGLNLVQSGSAGAALSGKSVGGKIKAKLTDAKGGLVWERDYESPNLRENARMISDDVYQSITGKRGIAASRIVFVGRTKGATDLYICNYDGSDLRQITDSGRLVASPSISANGRMISFTSYKKGFADIEALDLETGERFPLIEAPGTNTSPAFSPDGTRIALTMSHESTPDVYVAKLDEGVGHMVAGGEGVECSPAWSPEGKSLVLCSDREGSPQLYVVPMGGGVLKKLHTSFDYAAEPSWSPDGGSIAFTTLINGQSAVALFDMRKRKSTVIADKGAQDPCFGATGNHVLFSRGGTLYLRQVDTTQTIPIVSGFEAISDPAWSR